MSLVSGPDGAAAGRSLRRLAGEPALSDPNSLRACHTHKKNSCDSVHFFSPPYSLEYSR